MAISELATGTKAVAGTEWSVINDSSAIATNATDGIYQLWLDLSDMVEGDQLTIALYEKVRSGDTQRKAQRWTQTGVQADPNWFSPSVLLMHGFDWTLLAVSGTITVLWSLRSIA